MSNQHVNLASDHLPCRRMTLGQSLVILAVVLSGSAGVAEVKVAVEQTNVGSGFAFERIPSPAINDGAAHVIWTLMSGKADGNSAGLDVLHDGQVPAGDDEPSRNFFFAAGFDGGRILADFDKPIDVARISTYSRHNGDRAPQVYTVYGSNAGGSAFDDIENRMANPLRRGWKKIASVDTRSKTRDSGGRHAVAITDMEKSIGRFRYLLFDVMSTEKRNRFGLTFITEIDVIQADGPKIEFVDTGRPLKVVKFQSNDGDYQFHVDMTESPDLHGHGQRIL